MAIPHITANIASRVALLSYLFILLEIFLERELPVLPAGLSLLFPLGMEGRARSPKLQVK